jgi:lipopolysaccharide transport system permease protein
MHSPTVGQPSEAIEMVLEPVEGWVPLRLSEVWDYRELLVFLAWRDVSVRYKQTMLGIGWAIIQPACMVLVFSIFFGRLAKMPSEGVPYPVFSFAALMPWQYFSTAVANCSGSLLRNSQLLTKIYFPRLIIPLASVLPPSIDALASFILLTGMMLCFGVVPTFNLVWLPCFFLLEMITALGIGLWLASLNLEYRDVQHVIPFLLQILMFLSPVVYPSSIVPERWRALYALNPMVGVIDGFRWALFGLKTTPGTTTVVATLVALSILISGLYFFRRMEKSFADLV